MEPIARAPQNNPLDVCDLVYRDRLFSQAMDESDRHPFRLLGYYYGMMSRATAGQKYQVITRVYKQSLHSYVIPSLTIGNDVLSGFLQSCERTCVYFNTTNEERGRHYTLVATEEDSLKTIQTINLVTESFLNNLPDFERNETLKQNLYEELDTLDKDMEKAIEGMERVRITYLSCVKKIIAAWFGVSTNDQWLAVIADVHRLKDKNQRIMLRYKQSAFRIQQTE
jgi:hypothetical protein